MAYDAVSINVLDLRPSTGIGVAIPFNQPAVFQSIYTTKEQTKYNLINYILTEPGERLYYPEFGLGLRKKLFEQLTETLEDDIREMIATGIEEYFSNIEVTELVIKSSKDQNILTVELSYKITNTKQEDQIIINLENG